MFLDFLLDVQVEMGIEEENLSRLIGMMEAME